MARTSVQNGTNCDCPPSSCSSTCLSVWLVDIPAAHHAHHLLPRQLLPQLHRRRERGRAGSFRQIVRGPQRQPDPLRQLLLAQRHDIVEVLACRISNVRSNVTRVAMPSANVSATVADHALAPAPRAGERIGARRLHADDPRAGCRASSAPAHTAGPAAAADRHQNDVRLRQLLEHLQRICRHSRQSASARSPSARSGAPARRARASTYSRAASKSRPTSTTVAPRRASRRSCRDCCLRARRPCTERSRAGRRAQSTDRDCPVLAVMTPRALVVTQAADQIQSAANLEGARRIVVLVLHVQVEPGFDLEQRMPQQRRRLERSIDDPARVIDVGQREAHHTIVPCRARRDVCTRMP